MIVKKNLWHGVQEQSGTFLSSPLLLIVLAATALLLGGFVGMTSTTLKGAVVAGIIMIVIVLLRQDELATGIIIGVHLCLDWYLGTYVFGLIMALLLLAVFFLARSPRYRWAEPRALWLWVLFLGLAIFPAIRGALTPRDAFIYYPNVVVGALLFFWLGTVLGRDIRNLRLLFQILAAFGALIAIHTLIQATTGIFLFESSRVDAYVASLSNYQLVGSGGVSRLGSFFIQPDFNAIFLSMMIFIPLGLALETRSWLAKILYLCEMSVMLPALLATYSGAGWVAIAAGMVAFILLAGRMRYRVQIVLVLTAAVLVVFFGLPTQVSLLLQHISNPREILLRTGLWETAWRVIQAYPLTGVGLGHLAYLERAEFFRVPAQLIPYDHPHNSYLEWGAMAGLPVLAVFLALLLHTLWHTLRNWLRLDVGGRSLIAGGVAMLAALSISSWTNEGWTLPPLAAIGWLIFGVMSSPLLIKGISERASKHTGGEQH